MAAITSPEIQPHIHLHNGAGTAGTAKFALNDTSTTIYPKLPGGGSCKVVIIRRSIISNHGSVISICKNAGRWSYKILYAFESQPTRMPRDKWIAEIKRMGAGSFLPELLKGN